MQRILESSVCVCVTCSVLRVIRFPMVLLKKEARRGLRGEGCSKKAYRVSNSGFSFPSLSLMTATSHVSSSHAMLGYLQQIQAWSVTDLHILTEPERFHKPHWCKHVHVLRLKDMAILPPLTIPNFAVLFIIGESKTIAFSGDTHTNIGYIS